MFFIYYIGIEKTKSGNLRLHGICLEQISPFFDLQNLPWLKLPCAPAQAPPSA